MNNKSTGKSQLQTVISAILMRLGEQDHLVKNAAITSLRKMAKLYPNDIISESCAYCQESKPDKDHLTEILSVVECISQEYVVQIDGDVILMLIDFCLCVITQQMESEAQKLASEILVAVGKQHPIQVIEILSKNLENSCKRTSENRKNLPHPMILYTLGSLAAVNPCAVVPHLKYVLNLLLPLLGPTKSDIQNSLAYALGRFGDALNEYCLNGEKVPDPTLTTENFQIEISFICDSLTNALQSWREPKEALLALASLLPILNGDRVGQHTQQLFPILLNMCKKQKEILGTVQCLSSVILVSSQTNGTVLEPFLNNFITILVDLIQSEQDYAQPHLIRIHAEALRCFERLTKHFTDHCVDYLLKLLKSPTTDKNRLRSLIIFNHLVNSCEEVVKNRINNFIQILSELLESSSIAIRKTLLRTIVALSCKDLLPVNVQSVYISFILQLSYNYKPEKSETVNKELSYLQEAAENTLYLLSTTVPQLSDTLCQVLMQNLLQGKQHPIILRCLATLAPLKATYWKEPNVLLVIRCLIILGKLNPIVRSQNTLRFLKYIKPCSFENYKSVWENQIPQLLKYLEQNHDVVNEDEWKGLIVDFLSVSLEAVKNEEFTNAVLYTIRSSLENCSKEEIDLLLQLLAISVCHLYKPKQISPYLESILKAAQPYDSGRMQACAKALGICSKVHMKPVLDELNALRKECLTKTHSKLLGLFGGYQKNDNLTDKVRLLLLACYNEICSTASSQLLQTIESEILEFAVEELNNCKDISIRSACLETIRSVANVMHPCRNSLHIRMQNRSQVLQIVSDQLQLHSGPEYVQLFPCTLSVLTSLIKLPPSLEPDRRVQLLSHSISTILNASAVYCKITEDSAKFGDVKLACFVYNSFSELSYLIQEIILQNPDHFVLNELVLLVEPWLGRKKPEQRLPALEILKDALIVYLENCQFAYGAPGGFEHCGVLIAHLVPRCADSNKNVRKIAVECVKLALCIAARHEGHVKEYDKIIEQKLQKPLEHICSDEPRILYNLTMDIAHCVANHVPRSQLPHLINGLIDSLVDVEVPGCYGSSIVLTAVIKDKGPEVPEHIVQFLDKLLIVLNKIDCPRTRSTSLRSVVAMAVHFPRVVTTNLLSRPLPYQQAVCDFWAALSTDENIVLDMLDHFKKIFQTNVPYEEEKNTTDGVHIVTLHPLQTLCAMNELFKNTHLQNICKQHFPELFCRLLVTFAAYAGSVIPASAGGAPIPAKETYALRPVDICIQTIKELLLCCGHDDVASVLPGHGSINKLTDVLYILPKLADALCSAAPQILSWLVSCLAPYTRSEWISWRASAITFLASLLEFGNDVSSVLAENMIEILLAAQTDTNSEVRRAAFFGLGVAMQKLPWDITSRYCDGIVDALLRALEYYNMKDESQVILETLLSFSKLLLAAESNEYQISSCQVTAAVRIKPLFDQDHAELRAAAFHLLGDLANASLRDKKTDAFREQIYGDLVALLLHLVDENENVIRACKYTLQRITPVLKCENTSRIIKEHIDEDQQLNFTEFVTNLVIAFGKELQDLLSIFLQTCASYWKSDNVILRAHAALLARLFIEQLNAEERKEIPLDSLCHRLLHLCEDVEPLVRAQAIKTISCLFLHYK